MKEKLWKSFFILIPILNISLTHRTFEFEGLLKAGFYVFESKIWVFFCKVVTKKMMWENADQVTCGTYLVFCGLKHWSKGISNPNFKACMQYTNVNSTIWKNEASQNLAVLKPEHIDNYLNYLCAYSTDYMSYFVSKKWL